MPDKTVYGRLRPALAAALGRPSHLPLSARNYSRVNRSLGPACPDHQSVSVRQRQWWRHGNVRSCGRVDAAGVDVGACLTPATACLTLQYGYGLAVGNYDFAYTYSGTIYLAQPHTGTTNYDLVCTAGPFLRHRRCQRLRRQRSKNATGLCKTRIWGPDGRSRTAARLPVNIFHGRIPRPPMRLPIS